ncbi:MAG: hypothetical protein IPL52_04375 [Flavobacteriales bacterium]|nr:hypothetical protein [Flavobacteriales bacterium]
MDDFIAAGGSLGLWGRVMTLYVDRKTIIPLDRVAYLLDLAQEHFPDATLAVEISEPTNSDETAEGVPAATNAPPPEQHMASEQGQQP